MTTEQDLLIYSFTYCAACQTQDLMHAGHVSNTELHPQLPGIVIF